MQWVTERVQFHEVESFRQQQQHRKKSDVQMFGLNVSNV